MMIDSPCARNCCLNDDDICLGCYRSLSEILRWGDAPDDEKVQVLLDVEMRKAERQKTVDL